MFDFGLSELLLVGVVALVVLGPERLPQAARMAGQLVGKLQRLVSNVKQELSVQAELEELRKAKQEFEAAAHQFRDEMKEVGSDTQSSLNEISDGLKPWERLPEQRTPADFGLDEFGNPLPETVTDTAEQTVSAAANDTAATEAAVSEPVQEDPWKAYLSGASTAPAVTPVYEEILPTPEPKVMHMDSLKKRAMQRKRDMRPKFRAKPHLRVRKK